MNWLAHTFLSKEHIEYQLGNILADPMKCKEWSGISYRIKEGMHIHKLIDSFTDSHDIVKHSKSIIPINGYFKGVVLDVVYDYFLSIHWDKFASISKEQFLDRFHNQALEYINNNPLPRKADNVIRKVVLNRQLSSYSSLYGVQSAFKRIDTRLSPRALQKDNTTNYLPHIIEHKDSLEDDFLEFFPQLQSYIKEHISPQVPSYWK